MRKLLNINNMAQTQDKSAKKIQSIFKGKINRRTTKIKKIDKLKNNITNAKGTMLNAKGTMLTARETMLSAREELLRLGNEETIAEEEAAAEEAAAEEAAAEEAAAAAEAHVVAQAAAAECVVCMNALRTQVIIPCGHKCLCENCAEALETQAAAADPPRAVRCPLCQGEATGIFRVHE